MTEPRAVRVAIVDDAEMILTGFSLIVDHEDDLRVVGTAGNGREAVELCRRQPVDVVLMDIRMPVMDGLAATEAILALPDPPAVLILTTFGLDEYVHAAIAAGASGFLLKDASADDLVAAVRAVAAGDAVLSPAVTRIVVEQARRGTAPALGDGPPVPGIDDLTEREREVLEQLALGRSNAEIAEALFLSEATVKTHLGRVLAKLGVRDRVQAVICAFRAGIAEPG
ncbi:MAG: response regulator transcription factor [Acidimicrobiales bacterium]